MHILLVEDDPLFVDLIAAQLRRTRWVDSRLEVAGTLAEAVAKLAGREFGLVLADLNLPDSAGLGTVEALSRTGEQLIIVLSGIRDPGLRTGAIELGAYDFLSKDEVSAAALERLLRLAALQSRTFRSLRESEARFRGLVMQSSDWYWEQDEKLRFTVFEGRVMEKSGNDPKHAIGRRRWEMPGIKPVSCTWEEHRAVLESRQPFRGFVYSRTGDDGQLRYITVSGEPFYGGDGRFRGYRGLATDVTAQQRAEEELRRFRVAMEHSADMILIIDRATMRHVDVNSAACRLLGYSREELLTLGPQDTLPVSRAELEGAYDRLIADPSQTGGMTSYYRCKDGSRLPFESTRRVIRSGDAWLIAAISRDIRDRLAAEAALRESEGRFRNLTALSSDWYWEQDAELRFTRFEGGRSQVAKQAIGKRRWEIPGIAPPAGGWAEHRRALEAREPFRDLEYATIEAGQARYVSVSGEPMYDAGGAFLGYRGIARDITARKRGERLLALEHAVTRCLADAESDAAALREAMRAICESEGWESGRYFHLDAEAAVMRFRAAWSADDAAMLRFNEASRGMAVARGIGLVGRVWGAGEAVWVPDIGADPRVTDGDPARAGDVRCMAAFPVNFAGQTIGVLSLCSGETRAPDDRLLQTMRVIGSQVGQFLKRKEAEAAERDSASRFRSLTEISSDIYWEQDAGFCFTSVSGSGPEWLEERLRGLVGKRRWDQDFLNMSEADWAAHKALLAAHQPFRDLELAHAHRESGEVAWIVVSGDPVFDAAGAFTGYRGVGKDITARKRAERLRELEHRVTRCLADADSVADALRSAMRAICESEGWDSMRYFHLDEAADLMRFRESWCAGDGAFAQFNQASRGMSFERGAGLIGHAWASGEPLWVAEVAADPRVAHRAMSEQAGPHGAYAFPMTFEGRVIGVLGVASRRVREPELRLLQAMRVISSQIGQFLKRKETEEGLRASEERFRSLTNLSSDWYWEQDAEFRFTKFEGRGSGDYSPAGAVLGRHVWDLDGVVPESADWDAHRARLQRHESFHQFTYAYRDRSGRQYYVSADGEPVFDAQGAFTGYRGTARDITAPRRGEEELRRFRAAMDMSLDAIYLVDRTTMRFVDVNAAACRGVGYTREQLLNMGPEDLLAVPRAELERAYDEVIAKGATGVVTETSYVAANGRTGWTELHRRALRTADGWVIVSVSRDITERKVAEQRRAAHTRHQERIARFGQLALGKREPGELVGEAVQNVLEGLAAEAVAYVEPGTGERELVLRALVGVAGADARQEAVRCREGAPILQILRSGTRLLSEDPGLPYPWAATLRGAALVPVRGERGVRGALSVFAPQGVEFPAEEINFVEAVASVLSTALLRTESEGRLAYLAQFDPLTGLPNRALLADRFSQMIVRARRHGSTLGVLFIDLDEFKMVNDTLGHAGGDELLKEVSVRLQASVRPGDTVARISGDEFAVVLADLARPDDASLVAQKIIDRLGQAVAIGGQEVFVTGSVGIALFPGDGADAETLLGAADAAMYRAKQSGRNAYQFFTAEINQRSRARAQLGSELRRALERGEFFLVYQPKVALADRRPCGAEALLRWKHPERGTVSPVEFIPVLEETGLIVPVGEWVLRRACEDLKSWQAAGLQPGPVSVNLSARQFRLPDLDVRLKAIVAAAGVAPSLVELEITESQLVGDPDHAIRMMRSLCDAGMRIAIDDFGTGYSSLSYLTRFPVGALKIDRSFVRDLIEDKSDATIVRTIIEMAHTLGFTVVAEGIETEAQAVYLREHRCEEGQGFLFARPMPAAQLAALLGGARRPARRPRATAKR